MLSLFMILQDEERLLPQTLCIASKFVDKVIIIDTGSTGRTLELDIELPINYRDIEYHMHHYFNKIC